MHALWRGDDRDNLEGEFADVLAWLCTLANINDIDLAAAVTKKYMGEDAPKGASRLSGAYTSTPG